MVASKSLDRRLRISDGCHRRGAMRSSPIVRGGTLLCGQLLLLSFTHCDNFPTSPVEPAQVSPGRNDPTDPARRMARIAAGHRSQAAACQHDRKRSACGPAVRRSSGAARWTPQRDCVRSAMARFTSRNRTDSRPVFARRACGIVDAQDAPQLRPTVWGAVQFCCRHR